MGAAQSILLYSGEVWTDVLDKVHFKRIAQVQMRRALREAPAYRTVSEPPAMVIAGVIPVALLAKERKAIYRRKGENLSEVVASEERQRTFTEWQLSWQNEPRGRWTVRLIDNLDPWLNRTHDEIDYFLTQLLSGHGSFQSYLHRIGKARSPDCSAMEWRTTLNTSFSLARGGTAFVVETQGSFLQTTLSERC